MLEKIGSERTVEFYSPYDHNHPSEADTVYGAYLLSPYHLLHTIIIISEAC